MRVLAPALMLGVFLVGTGVPPATADSGDGDGSANGGAGGDDIYGGVHLGHGGSGGNGGGGSRCTWFPGDLGPLGLPVVTPDSPAATEPAAGGTTVALYLRRCPGQPDQWAWIQQYSAQQLAAIAADAIRKDLPEPHAAFSPPAARSVVHLPVWFAVPAAQWAPVSVTADVPGLSATVTATPTDLIFEPGDGGGQVSCAGPGPQWQAGMDEPASVPACSYTYTDASSIAPDGHAWAGDLSIRWRVAWAATNGQGGALNTLTTTSTYALAVREIQAVEETHR